MIITTRVCFAGGSDNAELYLIVGGGMTSDAAVHGIRERDRSGSIAVIAAEPHPPQRAAAAIVLRLWPQGLVAARSRCSDTVFPGRNVAASTS